MGRKTHTQESMDVTWTKNHKTHFDFMGSLDYVFGGSILTRSVVHCHKPFLLHLPWKCVIVQRVLEQKRMMK